MKTQSNSVSQWTSLPYASAPAGQWTHLAATYNGSKLSLYKNGALAEEKINILAISTSEIKISLIIEEINTLKAIKKLHKSFKLD